MKKAVFLFLVIVISCGFRGYRVDDRPLSWAQPVRDSSIHNFYKVDEYVYRSAQIDSGGIQQISGMGIGHVLNLRHSQTNNDKAEDSKITLHTIPMHVTNINNEDIINALKTIKEADKPILVHCYYGSDRTGVVIAMYRIVMQGWSKEDAIDELMNGGYGFHRILFNIPRYISNADIDKIKEAVNNP